MSTTDPLTNLLKPLSDSFLTVRVIKSFEFRTTKNLLMPHTNLETMTVGELKEFVLKGQLDAVRTRVGLIWGVSEIKTASGFKPYRTTVLGALTLQDHVQWIVLI